MSWIEVVFFSFQSSSTEIGWFKNACSPLLAVYGDALLKIKQLSKIIHQKPSAASCGIIQVFLVVSYAQNFQNAFISDRKLLNMEISCQQKWVARSFGITRSPLRNARGKKNKYSLRHFRVSNGCTKHNFVVNLLWSIPH